MKSRFDKLMAILSCVVIACSILCVNAAPAYAYSGDIFGSYDTSSSWGDIFDTGYTGSSSDIFGSYGTSSSWGDIFAIEPNTVPSYPSASGSAIGATDSGMSAPATCSICKGIGKCPKCAGTGDCFFVYGTHPCIDGELYIYDTVITCSSCNGSGECRYCGGNGKCYWCGGDGIH